MTALSPQLSALTKDARRPSVITVASVPAGHVYVQHLADVDERSVERLPDLRPPGDSAPGQWWPPVMLDPAWIDRHSDEFDIFHLHFGFDALSAPDLIAVVDSLRRAGKPLVYTVHDLRNPHHQERSAHDAALDVVIPAAEAVITLTEGAAGVIRSRWGREAHVVPHPHVLELDRIRPRSPRAGEFVVGIHAKSVRPNLRPLAVLAELLPLRHELPGLRLRFDVHRDVFDGDGPRHDPELAAFASQAARSGAVDLRVHDYFTEDELWAYLGALDLSVLPYRFGTHSGWVEACYDVGTTVLAPTCGFYAQQRPVLSYRHDESGLDGDSLREALRDAYIRRPVVQADRSERLHERRAIAAAHHEIYSAVMR